MFLPVSYNKGGAAEKLILDIIHQNEKFKKFKITCFTLPNNSVNLKYKYTKFVEVKLPVYYYFIQKAINLFYKVFSSPRRFSAISYYTAKLSKKFAFDKILIENNMSLFMHVYERLGNKNKYYFHLHNELDEKNKRSEDYVKILRASDKIFCVSKYIQNQLNKIESSKKNVVLYNVVDVSQMAFSAKDYLELSNLKNKLGVAEEDIILGYAGRISEEKGVLELAKAFKRASKVKSSLKLLIVGSSWFDSVRKTEFEIKLEKELETVKNRVIFSGYVKYDRMKLYYKLMNILVIPSKCQEAFGLVAIEGIVNKLPVISSTNGALVEVLGNNAYYIRNQYMVDDIYKHLLTIINSDFHSPMLERNGSIVNQRFIDPKAYFEELVGYMELRL